MITESTRLLFLRGCGSLLVKAFYHIFDFFICILNFHRCLFLDTMNVKFKT
jgi:hypothetical protein